jgi:hypothetical protein
VLIVLHRTITCVVSSVILKRLGTILVEAKSIFFLVRIRASQNSVAIRLLHVANVERRRKAQVALYYPEPLSNKITNFYEAAQ